MAHLLASRLVVPVDIDAAHVLAAGRRHQSVSRSTPEPAREPWEQCKVAMLSDTCQLQLPAGAALTCHFILHCSPDEANQELVGSAIPRHKAWEVASRVHQNVYPAAVVRHDATWPCPSVGSMLCMLGLGGQPAPLHPPEAQAKQAAAHAALAGGRHEGWAPPSGHQKGGSA